VSRKTSKAVITMLDAEKEIEDLRKELKRERRRRLRAQWLHGRRRHR
jgi:hypothetical protein